MSIRRRWSVRVQLYLLAAVVVAPLLSLLLVAVAHGYRSDVADAQERTRLFARLANRELAGYLKNTQELVQQLAALPVVREHNRGDVEDLFEETLGRHPEFTDLVLLDSAGYALNSPRGAALPSGESRAGVRILTRSSGASELLITAPVAGKDGKVQRWLVVPVNLIALSERLLAVLPAAPDCGLLTREGAILLTSQSPAQRVGRLVADPGMRRDLAAGGAATGSGPDADGHRYFYVLEPSSDLGAAVYARFPIDEILGPARRRLWENLSIVLVVVLALALLVRRLAHRIVDPLDALTAAAGSREAGTPPVPVEGPREIAALAEAFNTMRREEKATAEALRRNEAYFRAIFDDGGGAVMISGPARFIEVANDRACAMLGYSRRELGRLTWLDLTHPDDRASGEERWARLQRGELDAYDVDKRYVRKDGTTIHVAVAVAVNAMRDATGRVERLVAHLTDVTDRKLAEQRSRESEQRLELALRGGDLGWWDYDIVTGRAVANARFRELLGVAPGEYEDQPQRWRDLVHPDDRAACVQAFTAHVAGATEFYEAEHRMVRPDGVVWWVLDRGCVTARDAGGRATRVSGTIRDITVRKRAELGLAAEKQRFEDLVHSIDGIVWEQDAVTGQFTFVSRRAEEILGYAVSRWIEEPGFWADHLHPDDRRWVPALRHAESVGQNERDFLYRMIASDGRTVWLHETLSATIDVARRPVLRRGVMLDVTGRRMAEERLGAVVRALPDVVFLFDRDGTYLECFTGAPELLVVPREKLIGRHYRENIPTELAERITECFAELRESAELVGFSYELVVRGGRRNFEARFVACEGDRVLAIIRDVTSRAVAEAALRDSEARYRLVVEQTGQMVYEVDLTTGKIRWFGEAAVAAITGWTLAEFQAVDLERCNELIHPDDRDASGREFDRCRASGEPFRSEYRFRRKDGEYRAVEDLGVFLCNEDGKAVRMYGRMGDITEARRGREERERFNRKLQETQKLESLGVLAGGIAHDFNNLLTGVLGNASLLRLQLPAGSPQLESVEDIEKAAMAAADLCKQMLAYSGRGRLTVQRVDLAHLVQNCASLLQISVSKRAHLRFHLPPAVPPIVADATQLRQILMNFVINASEAITVREGLIDITVDTIDASRAYLDETHLSQELSEGRYVFLEVTDNGCGMSEETVARIFDPFFTTKFTGRGLGLAAVLGIVRSHHGAIRVSSREGEGTTFRVLLPVAAGNEATRVVVEESAPLPPLTGTVLVADDEAPVRKVAQRLLTNLGFDVVTAVDGVEAVELFQSAPGRYRLVLLDLTMPAMDGREAFRLLREVRSEVPVIFMSGFNAQDATELFGRETAALFLQKPFTAEGLAQAVLAALGLARG